MKKYFIAFLIYNSIIFFTRIDLLAQSLWDLENDSMNLAILVSDFQTYEFETGHFSIHQPCDSCDIDSLPFDIYFISPSDFGWITFTYTETQDTLFYASINWMGIGKIIFPENFLSSDSFNIDDTIIQNPLSIKYYEYCALMPDSTFKQKADSAWHFVKPLDIVKEFAEHPYRVGIYLYPPTVGHFDPSVAKWIVFIYRGKVSTNQIFHLPYKPNKFKLLLNYPNPFSKTTTITYTIKQHNNVSVEIYNISGKKTRTLVNQFRNAGNYSVSWDGTDENNMPVSKGVYYIKLSTGNNTLIRKAVKMK